MNFSLKNGTVFDAITGCFKKKDIYISRGKIVSTHEDNSSTIEVDCNGCYITPGLIDFHTHLYHTAYMPASWAGEYSINADTTAPFWGVTTMIDAGSSGWRNWDHFKVTVINNSRTRILAFLNICGYGMLHEAIEQEIDEMDIQKACEYAVEYQDRIIGFKTAHYRASDWNAVDRALAAGKYTSLPTMVDFGFFRKERPIWTLLNEKMGPGDILTHCFRGTVPWFNKKGQRYEYLDKARERGVKFDLGHGGGSFLFRNAIPAIRSGFYPDIISTDAHMHSLLGSMQNLPTCMNRLFTLGMPLEEVFRSVTIHPASAIGREELAKLENGSCADIALWSMRKGDFAYSDSVGGRITGNEALECEMTIREGSILYDRNARASDSALNKKPGTGIRLDQEWLLDPENSPS